MKFKKRIYRLVEKGSHGKKINLIFDYVIMSLIVLSITSIILESIKEISSDFKIFLEWFDIFSVAVFSIEYLMRLYVSNQTHPASNKFKSVLKFVFSMNGLIDLFAILPFYLPLLIKIDLRFLRTLRLIRFLRILKINRYTKSLNLIWAVLKDKKSELAVTGFVTLLLLIFASFIMYNVEGEKQPDAFPNILAAFWWAVATLTTVGYGDVYPITGIGKFVSGIMALMGIGVVALPTGIIGSGFMDRLRDDKKCPHCGKKID
ncbi:ion transporter [Saccharicrinis fermentans]|uniref:MlotiK1 channel n=1 Tax=Saccharicrinis fermentans DSM 9555 = JCM 21142 TaxID=869213 RepID=W7YBY1_9BACT|nr:ion transporter [Saccharicrinis fermentans]GAF05957.1 MlotiK1 channel [Saccharicrinis fermentans DSM 9555 = JCM 21142]